MKLLERMQCWLGEHPNVEAFLWFVAAVACIAILVWFFLFSGYGDPPEFVYEQFLCCFAISCSAVGRCALGP